MEGRFEDPTADSRDRIAAAQRLLDAYGHHLLPAELFEVLAAVPLDPATRRYLVNVAPSDAHAATIIAAAPSDERRLLLQIAKARRPTR